MATPTPTKSKTTDAELDEIYNAMDALMHAGCFAFIDDYLFNLRQRVWRTDIDKLMAYVISTMPAKSKLPARHNFLATCKHLFPNEDWSGLD